MSLMFNEIRDIEAPKRNENRSLASRKQKKRARPAKPSEGEFFLKKVEKSFEVEKNGLFLPFDSQVAFCLHLCSNKAQAKHKWRCAG